MKVYGYARVSTDKQDADRQELEIRRYAVEASLPPVSMVHETISSRKKKREVFKLIGKLEKGDVLIVNELSRLARSAIELDEICVMIHKAGAHLESLTPRFTVDESIMGQTMKFAIGISAQLERDFISERTKSALRARKVQGVKLGRPTGQGRIVEDAAEAAGVSMDMLNRLVETGASAASMARMLKLDARTVRKWIETKAVK